MRPFIRDFVNICSETLDLNEPVYEFGSRISEIDQRQIANLRPLFAGKKYVGCDIQSGEGVDKLIDACDTGLLPCSVGTVIMVETLEHLEFPREAMREIFRRQF